MCEPSKTMQRALAMSVRSGELADSPKVSREADVARATTLGEGRFGAAVGTVCA